MIKNATSLSQPLNSRSYNDYLSQKMNNPATTSPSTIPMQNPMEQAGVNQLDVSNFASELRSQKTVSALMSLSHPKNGLAPTLSEKGGMIDKNGNISMPEKRMNIPQTTTLGNSPLAAKTRESVQKQNVTASAQEQPIGIPINKGDRLKNAETPKTKTMNLNGMRFFALDTRSLGVLNKISTKKDVSQLDDTSLQTLSSQGNKAKQTELDKLDGLDENSSKIGKLSAQYESSTKGSTSIGYDRNGGTSYGTYQISSRAGTFDQFLGFLDKKAPQWADKLREAGKANTGSRNGAVPDAWKQLCAEDPEKMKTLEHDFIIQSHYEPVASYVEENWKGNISPALSEVIFSTAVQHGVRGAKQVFNQALADIPEKNSLTNSLTQSLSNTKANTNTTQDNAVSLLINNFLQGQKNNNSTPQEVSIKDTNNLQDQATLIKNIYAHRETKFGSSTLQVQESARNRFVSEEKKALSMLG